MTKTISTKVPEELAERIEEYQEDGENRSAAVRRLIRSGLDQRWGHRNPYYSVLLVWTGMLLWSAAFLDVDAAWGQAGAVLALLGWVTTSERVRSYAALAGEELSNAVTAFRTPEAKD